MEHSLEHDGDSYKKHQKRSENAQSISDSKISSAITTKKSKNDPETKHFDERFFATGLENNKVMSASFLSIALAKLSLIPPTPPIQ